MATPKKFFHDHLVLLLLSINAFLALAGSIFLLVRLGTSHGNGFIVQYRAGQINAFQTGSVFEILSFVVFAMMVLAIHGFVSLRAYPINRNLSVAILGLGMLLLVLDIIISNALIVLR